MKREAKKLAKGLARVCYRPDTSVIDKFLKYLEQSLRSEFDRLEKEIQAISEKNSDYKSHLVDYQTDMIYISDLGDELSILALFKDFEIKLIPFLQSEFPKHKVRHLNCCTICLVLGVCEKSKKDESECYELLKEKMRYISSFYELKCLNNSIKHNGVVNEELAAHFGEVWGRKGDKLTNIHDTYQRLKCSVVDFYNEFVDKVYEEEELRNG